MAKRIQPLGYKSIELKIHPRYKSDNLKFTVITTIDLPSTLLTMIRPVDLGYGRQVGQNNHFLLGTRVLGSKLSWTIYQCVSHFIKSNPCSDSQRALYPV